jgi:Ala-tRNA(Pro) deacylase
MAANRVKEFLDAQGVRYVTLAHSVAYTATEVASSAHVRARDFAKTLIVLVGGAPAMVVLPANRRLLLPELREMLETEDVKLASELEIRRLFPDCELGAMPPFGHLYGMPVHVAASLAHEREIAFNAGTHTEVIKLAYADFDRLAKPRVIDLVTT